MPNMIKAFKTAPATIVSTYTYTFTERDIRRPDGYRNADVFTMNAGFFEWADAYLKAVKKVETAKKNAEKRS